MIINNTHIMVYILVAIIGAVLGQFVSWLNIRLPENKKVFTLEIFRKTEEKFKLNYILMLINAIIYLGLLYKYRITLEFFKFAFLSTSLISAFMIDYKLQIIPNRLNLTIFEMGLIFTFILSCQSVNIALQSILGMLIGGGIFVLITFIGGLIAGKETMGFGDVKLMGALGLYFGSINIVIIAVLAFFIGAIVSVILIATKKKSKDEYIPFGPFIVIASGIAMFIPTTVMMKMLLLGLY